MNYLTDAFPNTVTKTPDVGYFEEHFGIHVHVDT